MRFSIIVVSFNPGNKLRDTLKSINSQTFKDFEVIVKDASSTDDSLDCIGEFNELPVRVISEPDRGIYDGMNIALSKAIGEYVYFLNCGDALYSDTVLSEVDSFIDTAKKDTSIVYGDIFDRPSQEVIASNPKLDGFGCYRNLPCHQAVFYRRELILEHPFEIKYLVRADYEQFLWCVYEKKIMPLYSGILIADYEGRGFSETGDRVRLSSREHKEITSKYMSLKERFGYRTILILTLAPLRRLLARSRVTSGLYNSLKSFVYKNKR